MRVLIEPLNLRDLTFICSNLRDADRREISCQLPEGVSGSDFGAGLFYAVPAEFSWLARLDGQPVAAFGFQPFNVATWTGWAFGTDKMRRAVPVMTLHLLAQEAKLLARGVRRVEVRRLSQVDYSSSWLRALGCTFEHVLGDFGRNGEAFELWAWSLANGKPTERSSYNVHPQAA